MSEIVNTVLRSPSEGVQPLPLRDMIPEMSHAVILQVSKGTDLVLEGAAIKRMTARPPVDRDGDPIRTRIVDPLLLQRTVSVNGDRSVDEGSPET